MKLTLSIKNIAYGLLAILAAGSLLWLGGIKYRRQVDSLNVALYQRDGKIKEQTLTIGKLQQHAFYAEAAVIHSEATIKSLKSENEYLKKLKIKNVKTISDLQVQVEVLKKKGEYKDTIIEDAYVDDALVIDANAVVVPKKETVKVAKYKDEWAWCNVTLAKEPVFDFGLSPATDIKVIVGYQGFIKLTPTAVVTTPNPYIKVSKNNTIIVEEKKTFIQKRYPYLIAGFVVGVLLAK